jgi:hypothetical protein
LKYSSKARPTCLITTLKPCHVYTDNAAQGPTTNGH